ncbi:MAG TPA: Gfo/Idh/MocA family oxidoreductase [Roseiflexaceae bacterium]|nr:Gfo/Idh/MocA family oxidoreductase [Roseiflexaceae bacterium]
MTADEALRWGILGTGNIARQFARGLALLPNAQLVAVGSRSQGAADAFAREFGVAHSHPTYEELAHNPEVQAVYIATPHPLHHTNTLLCLAAGKHVLCEKPFTLNAREAAELVSEARSRGLFLMEAMWTRFLPALVQVRNLLAAGAIGEPRTVMADFGYRAPFDPASRLFDPALGGGALLDVGIYPISLASMVFGPPDRICSMADIGQTGVDEQAAVVLGHGPGRMALLFAASRTASQREAFVLGTEGQIKIHAPWYVPTRVTLARPDRGDEQFDLPLEGNGYQYEAAEVARCLRAGLTESPVMPLDETLALMRTLDAIRAQWDMRYPGE